MMRSTKTKTYRVKKKIIHTYIHTYKKKGQGKLNLNLESTGQAENIKS